MVKHVNILVLILLLCYEPLVGSKKIRKRTELSSRLKNKTKNQATKIFYHRNTKWPSPRINVNWRSIYVITKKPTNRVHCKIFCRSGYHLQVLPSGLVRGTVMQTSKHGE